jgi:hypothetical protein
LATSTFTEIDSDFIRGTMKAFENETLLDLKQRNENHGLQKDYPEHSGMPAGVVRG